MWGCVWGTQKWFLYFKKLFIYLFLERGEGRQRERERNIDMKEKHVSVAFAKGPTRIILPTKPVS